MRVLHVTPYFAPAFGYGGPPRTVYGLCRALANAGVGIHVVTTTANGASELPAAPDGTTYRGVPVRYCRRRAPHVVWNADALARAIDDELRVADLVHIHGLWHRPGWIAASAARRTGRPYVISPRGMLQPAARAIHGWRKRIAFAAVERRNLSAAALLHATSDAEASALAAMKLSPPIAVIANGVDMADEPGDRPGLPALGDRPVVLFLGRIHPIKRLDLLAAAARRLTQPAVIVVAGPDEQGYRASIEPAFAGVDVHWAGAVDESHRAAWLRRAAVLVACSDSESFGMSVAEAMAASVPVVVTRTVPWPDVETARAGRWVAQEPEAMAHAIDELLSDRRLAAEMGGNGRALVERMYAWPAVARQMIAQYRAMIR